MKNRLLSTLLALSIMITSSNIVFASEVYYQNTINFEEMTDEEYSTWKSEIYNRQEFDVSAINTSYSSNYIRNDYIESYISTSTGEFTIGTTGGNPEINTDDNKMLTYSHPDSETSETLIRIDDTDYFFYGSETVINDNKAISTAVYDDIKVTQTLSFVNNTYTDREDIISIEYTLTNTSNESKDVGARIMLDTMLGDNDGAPFRVANYGEIIYETEFVGDDIPQYWQAFDTFEDPNVIASGIFYRNISQRPDKVQFAYWGRISSASWDYSITDTRSITGDSAVAAYYNPITLSAGESRVVSTYYGLSEFIDAQTGELAMYITAPSALETNQLATVYEDNPFTVSVYTSNNTGQKLTGVKATISLPEEIGLFGNQSNVIDLGDLSTNTSANISWQVWAVPQNTATNVNYTITITSNEGVTSQVVKTLYLPSVNYYDVSALSLNKNALSISRGSSEQLTAYINREQALRYEVRWETTDPSVATVGSDGTVVAVSDGTCYIKAISADNKYTAYAQVTIENKPLTDLNLWSLSKLVYADLGNHKNKYVANVVDTIYESEKIEYTSQSTDNIDVKYADFFKEDLAGFKILDVLGVDNGFYGAAFEDCNGEIVIAYRGSDDRYDWVSTDFPFTFYDQLDYQFYAALEFYKIIKATYPNKEITLTGHSLGGALATFVSIIEDVEAITFNGANGLVIDLTYFINANYIEKFNGIDNWKFINYYNTKDIIVGSNNADLYKTAYFTSPISVNRFVKQHTPEIFLEVNNGIVSLVNLNYNDTNSYYNDYWTRNMGNQTGITLESALFIILTSTTSHSPIDASKLNSGWGRLLLGTENESLKTLTVPSYIVELRDNIVFTGGDSIVTGNPLYADTFYFKSGDDLFGKGGKDTYITFETAPQATIYDKDGTNEIIFKNVDMSNISVTKQSSGIYVVKTTQGGYIVVTKDDTWLTGNKVYITDKNGISKEISDFSASASAVSMSETEEKPITITHIQGNNVDFAFVDENQEVVMSYDTLTQIDGYKITEDVYVYGDLADIYVYDDLVEISLHDTTKSILVYADESVTIKTTQMVNGQIYSLLLEDYIGEPVYVVDYLLTSDGQTPIEGVIILDTITEITRADSVSTDIKAGDQISLKFNINTENPLNSELIFGIKDDSDNCISISSDDNVLDIIATCEGNATIIVSTLDGSGATLEIPITVSQDEFTGTILGYTEGTWSDEVVTLEVTAGDDGYNTIVMYNTRNTSNSSDTGSLTINTEGTNTIKIYAMNENGNITKAKTMDVLIDMTEPTVNGVYNGKSYYIEKTIYVLDKNDFSITLNGQSVENETVVNQVGTYELVATDASGKSTAVSFEILAVPTIMGVTEYNALTQEEQLVVISQLNEDLTAYRNEYEDVKYEISESLRNSINTELYILEMGLSTLENSTSSEAELLTFLVDYQLMQPTFSYISNGVYEITIYIPEGAEEMSPTVTISAGATISPIPTIAQDFSDNDVVYTVTSADGTVINTYTIKVNTPQITPILSAVAGNSQVTLTWNDPFGETGFETQFTLYMNGQVIYTGADTTYIQTGLINGTSYEFTLTATNGFTTSIVSTITARPTSTGSGSSSSGSSSSSNSSSSDVTTVINVDGSSSIISVDEDGNTVRETTFANGVKVTQITTPSGKITANTQNIDEDMSIVIYTDEDLSYSIVALVTYEDGRTAIIKDSVVTSEGLKFTLGEDATITLIDNAKTFIDSHGWYSEAIDFVTAREIFNGTSSNTFSPNDAMQRSMIWTVLYRYDGGDGVTTGSNWYAIAQKWSMENGISDGTNPDEQMTREQLATLLYRYENADSTTNSVNSYPDAGNISNWAEDAMNWAVTEGLLLGDTNGNLNPTNTATRAEVATILMRYINK